ncbi:hypothetical protein EJB05_56873 [Eragrostis curvula]|uniref:UDP-glycosyltransferases domain-containing protein n=1 Tax=Eragrostis curvula TaxID=38414 RepID=A0A5J9SF76_9POAL|nr:hypothetical protein EJB05_56873 [Eragrostis curvula]
MELSHRLVERGFEVTFVNTELIHTQVLEALRPANGGAGGNELELEGIRLVSIPDGMSDGEDRRDLGKFVDAFVRHVPGYVEQLIRETEASGRAKVKWLVGDVNGAVLRGRQQARRPGRRRLAGVRGVLGDNDQDSAADRDGWFDENGSPMRRGSFELAPGMPKHCPSQMAWSIDGVNDGSTQKFIFQTLSQNAQAASRFADVVVCNSFLDAEAVAFEQFPNILPIGPLFADGELRKPVGHFLPEDERCLRWLDSQPDRSVVYVAFGSFTVFDPRQFEELALGLELTGRPFSGGAPGLHHRQPEQGVVRRVPAPRRRPGHGGQLVSPAEGPGARRSGMLRVPLRLEFNNGGREERRAILVLAILLRPAHGPELHLRHMEDRPSGVAR